nr:MarR family transcriptional regulator [Propionicimonas sp.]
MPARDSNQADGFVGRFAATLAEAGMPPLAARVFATLLASETGRMTATELAERLHASTGGISGAVRYLIQVRMIRREHEPGTRRHIYAVDSSWYDAVVSANPVLVKGETDLREGIAALGDSPAAVRLAETLELIQFLREESEAMLRRWQERRAHAWALSATEERHG